MAPEGQIVNEAAEGQLVRLDEARTRLAKVVSIDEAKQIRDQGHAIRHYAKEQRLGREIQNSAAEVTIRAERRCGELLAVVERTPPKESGAMKGRSAHDGRTSKTYTETLKDSGIAPTTAQRWQAEASVPEPVFELFVAQTKNKGEELTSAAVQRLAASVETKPDRERKKQVAAMPSVRWARQMRALSFAVQSFVEIAKQITSRERELLRKDLARCIAELRAAEKEIG